MNGEFKGTVATYAVSMPLRRLCWGYHRLVQIYRWTSSERERNVTPYFSGAADSAAMLGHDDLAKALREWGAASSWKRIEEVNAASPALSTRPPNQFRDEGSTLTNSHAWPDAGLKP